MSKRNLNIRNEFITVFFKSIGYWFSFFVTDTTLKRSLNRILDGQREGEWRKRDNERERKKRQRKMLSL